MFETCISEETRQCQADATVSTFIRKVEDHIRPYCKTGLTEYLVDVYIPIVNKNIGITPSSKILG